ncbi:MAG: hypothetical protein FI723_00720, partial [SAR202 cluster bacterium]|nr:hypothetical protein [SAR202 cluster bacterium]
MPDATVKFEGARFIITMDLQRRIIADGSLIVQGQNIIQVGKAAELAGVGADRVIDASDMVITPGFCNGHMHISYAHATRGIFPDDLGSAYLPNVFKLQQVCDAPRPTCCGDCFPVPPAGAAALLWQILSSHFSSDTLRTIHSIVIRRTRRAKIRGEDQRSTSRKLVSQALRLVTAAGNC